jgi:hypothetical protein
MPQRGFANQKAFIEYAEQNGLVYAWQGSSALGGIAEKVASAI